MKFLILFILLLTLSLSKTMAMKGNLCWDRVIVPDDSWMLILPLTSGTTASSSSFTSSTGPCKADYFPMKEKKLYIAHNLDELKEQISKGEGEHLMALIELFGKQEKDYKILASNLQNNYYQIFKYKDINHIIDRIDKVIN